MNTVEREALGVEHWAYQVDSPFREPRELRELAAAPARSSWTETEDVEALEAPEAWSEQSEVVPQEGQSSGPPGRNEMQPGQERRWAAVVDPLVRATFRLTGPGLTGPPLRVLFLEEAGFAARFPRRHVVRTLVNRFILPVSDQAGTPLQSIMRAHRVPDLLEGMRDDRLIVRRLQALRRFVEARVRAGGFRGEFTPPSGSISYRPRMLIARLIGGFTTTESSRGARRILVQAPADVQLLVHEACHFYAHPRFIIEVLRRATNRSFVGMPLDEILLEGMAEHFARTVIRTNQVTLGPVREEDYQGYVVAAWRIIQTTTEAKARAAYFQGNPAAIRRLFRAVDLNIRDYPLMVPDFVISSSEAEAYFDAESATEVEAPVAMEDLDEGEDVYEAEDLDEGEDVYEAEDLDEGEAEGQESVTEFEGEDEAFETAESRASPTGRVAAPIPANLPLRGYQPRSARRSASAGPAANAPEREAAAEFEEHDLETQLFATEAVPTFGDFEGGLTGEPEIPEIDRRKTTSWAIASVGSGSVFVVGFSGFLLVNRETGREHTLLVPVLDASIFKVSASASPVSYTAFETTRPVSFDDFSGTFARVTSAYIGVFLGYSIVYLTVYDSPVPFAGDVIARVRMTGWGAMLPGGDVGHGITKVTYGSGRRSGVVPLVIAPEPDETSNEPALASIRMAAKESPRLAMPTDILFDFDSAAIKPSAQKALLYLADLLNNRKRLRVDIEGHTDSIGRPKYNLDLSERRANAVKKWFVDRGVTGASDFVVVPHGETKPVASNSTVEGRRRNRRVVIRADWNI